MSLPLVAFPTGFLMHPMSSWFPSLNFEMCELTRKKVVMTDSDTVEKYILFDKVVFQRPSMTSALFKEATMWTSYGRGVEHIVAMPSGVTIADRVNWIFQTIFTLRVWQPHALVLELASEINPHMWFSRWTRFGRWFYRIFEKTDKEIINSEEFLCFPKSNRVQVITQ